MYAGLGCAECGGTCPAAKGLGSIDLASLSWEDYLLFGIGSMVVYSIAAPDSRLFNSAPSKRKRRRKSSGAALGTVFAVALVGGLGYLIYSSNA